MVCKNPEGKTPTNFGTALYYSGFSLTTLGTGDLVPKTSIYRLLTIFEAALGFSVFTLITTDVEKGADLYVSLRRQWNPTLAILADYMAYNWHQIVPHE